MRVRRSLCVLGLVGAGACAGAPPPPATTSEEPASSAPPAPERRFALLWSNAFVFTGASAHGDKARMKSYPDGERAARTGDVWPLEVLDEQGELVKVRTLGVADAEHCYRGPAALNPLSLVLYVRRSDLAPVTSAPTTARFDDGTAVVLNAGVALSLPDESHFAVHGLSLAFAGDTGGATYAHAPAFAVREVTTETRDALHAGGAAVDKGPLASFPVWRTRPAPAGTAVTVLTPCALIEARSPTEPELVAHHPVDARDAASRAVPQSAKHFPIGTRLYFADGRVAGETVDALALSLLEEKNDRLCFQRSLAEPGPGEPMPVHHRIDVCLSAADARAEAQPRSDFRPRVKPPREAAPTP